MELKKIDTPNIVEKMPMKLIENFLSESENFNKNESTYYRRNIIMDFLYYVDKDISKIKQEDFYRFQLYMERKHRGMGINDGTLNFKLNILRRFFYYLYEYKIVTYRLKDDENIVIRRKISKDDKNKPSYKKKIDTFPEIVNEFAKYLKIKNYGSINHIIRKLLLFNKFLLTIKKDIQSISRHNNESEIFYSIQKFQMYYEKKITSEEIKVSTVTNYLSSIKLFIGFLHSKKIIKNHYVIPKHLRGSADRTNEYALTEDTIKLLNNIYKLSNNVLRDLAVFLIIVDTGCRPIEIENLTIHDINKTESTIKLYSKKSGERKLKLSKEVMLIIQDYLEIRSFYNPSNDSLFFSQKNTSLRVTAIYGIFYKANLNTFEKMKHSPKTYRHTFITNALDQNNFDQVSKTVGHKHWVSTFYYLFRSKTRLLDNTINYSPLKNKGV